MSNLQTLHHLPRQIPHAIIFIALVLPRPSLAEDTRWRVDKESCVATISNPGQAVEVIGNRDGSVQMSFSDDGWSYAQPQELSVSLNIDSKWVFDINNAQLVRKSLKIDLPRSDIGILIIKALREGSRLSLTTPQNEQIQSYTLNGSGMAIADLLTCM